MDLIFNNLFREQFPSLQTPLRILAFLGFSAFGSSGLKTSLPLNLVVEVAVNHAMQSIAIANLVISPVIRNPIPNSVVLVNSVTNSVLIPSSAKVVAPAMADSFDKGEHQ